MLDLGPEALGTVGALLILAATFVLIALSRRRIKPGEGIVVYRFGRTGAPLIHGGGRSSAIVLPLIHRGVRVKGGLAEAWEALRRALPRSWWVKPPERDAYSGDWMVLAGSPSASRAARHAEGRGSSQAEALRALATAVPEVLGRAPDSRADATPVFGVEQPPAWRRFLRNPYRLPMHGNHFFLLPESLYTENEPSGPKSANDGFQFIDILVTFGLPLVVVAVLMNSCMA